ncbi:MAG: hypothetical protein JJ891_06780 [Rhizobiaceae bacterium]|nr:hypothetical protein [Rhizobiaceae bacterium]
MSTEKLMDAMALWEHIIEGRLSTYRIALRDYKFGPVRERASRLIGPLNEAWLVAVDCDYSSSFAWEFIPEFMRECVDDETLELIKDPKEWALEKYGPKTFTKYIVTNDGWVGYTLWGVDDDEKETFVCSRTGEDAIKSLVRQMNISPIFETRLAS